MFLLTFPRLNPLPPKTMASSTPPPHCTLTTTKPYQNHHHHHHNHNLRPPRQSHRPPPRPPQSHRWPSNKAPVPINHPPSSNVHPTPPSASAAAATTLSSNSELAADFSGRRSTRFVSKMHFGRPRTPSSSSRHSSAAEEALQQAVRFSGDDSRLDAILLAFESELSGPDDYAFLLRELGNRGEWSMALRCFDFAICRLSRRRNEQGKLASTMISTLGRLGKVDLAKTVFDNAVSDGYGSTVYAYSALISAYAKSGYCDEAIRVFETMKDLNLKPNLVTYNALIDACGKGGADFKRASEIFDEMLTTGVQPDRITYNSLIAVCGGAGLWDKARCLFDEMLRRGVDQDIYTFNTLLDAACNGGHMEAAFEIMAQMSAKNIMPNQITYSTVIRGCHKAGKLDKALNLFDEMKYTGMKLDRVSYNNLLGIYASLGRFEEALTLAEEMASMGINKDVVTYNALIDGFGKQGRYDKVKELFAKMKAEGLSPNLLTYSTLISVYSKGGLYQEAMKVYGEFKQHGLKADVVFYSNLIDALCKKGFVESSAMLLDEMMEGGIQPNVVTYNSIINAFGSSNANDYPSDGEQPIRSKISVEDVSVSKPDTKGNDRIIKIFEQLASNEPAFGEGIKRGGQDFQCVLKVFQKMHEMEIKPNVVTFSAILNACSRCSSFQEASLLLEELRLFDNHVYGVAHGLLMGTDEKVWMQALSLFDDVKQMDSSTASAFYNALTDMLWHFGQRRGAQLVVLEGKRRQVWESTCTYSCLDLHLMSSGAARAMVHAWLLDIRSFVSEGHELPELISILTGWGKHSKVVGDGALKRAVEALLTSMGAPFWVAKRNIGRFISTGAGVASWLRESGTLQVLVLKDDRSYAESLDAAPALRQRPL